VIPGPRVVATSTVDMTHAPGYRETHGAPGLGYTGTTETRRAAREKVSSGAQVIHVKATGAGFGFFEPTTLLLNLEELEAAISEAHRLGVRTTTHACGAEGMRNAVRAGTQSIEHGQYLYEAEDIVPEMLDGQVGWVPTLMNNLAKFSVMEASVSEGRSTGLPASVERRTPALVEAHRRSFEMAMEAGVLVGLGTDVGAPFTPNGTNARELECFVDYGATEMQAIEAATSVNARILRMEDQIGTVEVGKLADLIVVRGNPLEDIRVLQAVENVVLVLKGGKIVVDRRDESGIEMSRHLSYSD
jgi:imidazolonepropionase-like amidohydrolase